MLTLADIFVTFADTLTGHAVFALYLFAMADRHAARAGLKKLPALLPSPLLAAAAAMGLYLLIPHWGAVRYACSSLLILTLCTLWTMRALRLTFWQALAASGMAAILQVSTSALARSLVGLLPVGQNAHFAAVLAAGLLLAAAGAFLMRRFHLERCFWPLIEESVGARRTALLILALEVTTEALFLLVYGVDGQYLILYYFLTAALTVLMIGFIATLARRFDDARRLEAQRDIIAQQQLYEQDLEAIRQEARAFRHDTKNLLAGLAEQAGAGETQQLRAALADLGAGFDRRLGEKIRATAQLGNVRLPPVRSLLLTKLAAMREAGVDCRLEALYPVESVGMDMWDFVRCLGILIDNAAEAAGKAERPWVEILLLARDGALDVRVANPWDGGADPARFWEEGWSTKGAGRGLGLASYQRILAQYPNAASRTHWSDGVFAQSLTIGGAP